MRQIESTAANTAEMCEAELVGAFVRYGCKLEDVKALPRAEDFSNKELGECWAAIVARLKNGLSTDPASVAADLTPAGADCLAEAHAMAYTKQYVAAHAALVVNRGAARTMIARLRAVDGQAAEDVAAEASAILSEAKERINSVDDDRVFSSTKDRMLSLTEYADRAFAGDVVRWPTGIDVMSKSSGGFRPGATWIVGARPSVGKSALLMQMAAAVAHDGGKALFVSLEMPAIEIAKREVALKAGAIAASIDSGNLTASQIERLNRAASDHAAAMGDNLTVADKLGSDAEQIAYAIKRMIRRRGVDVVFVDYIQRLYAPGLVGRDANRNTELEVIVNLFADMARQDGVAVVLASQLKRGSGGEPSMDSLRDSGALEAAADVVLLIHREHVDDAERKLIIAKNRQGRTCSFMTYLDFDKMRFYELNPPSRGASNS